MFLFFFYRYGDHLDLHVLTHSFPPRRSSDLPTVLFDLHRELGGKMVPFAGYALPVQYPAGIMAEHQHTREAATLFDVSHMGQLRLDGADRAATLEALVPVDVARSEEHTSELQSLMRISYAVFCLKKKK